MGWFYCIGDILDTNDYAKWIKITSAKRLDLHFRYARSGHQRGDFGDHAHRRVERVYLGADRICLVSYVDRVVKRKCGLARTRGAASEMVETIPAKVECRNDIFSQRAGHSWSGRYDLWLDGRKFIVTMVPTGRHQLIRASTAHAVETHESSAQSMADGGTHLGHGRLRDFHHYGFHGVRCSAIARMGISSTLVVVATYCHIDSRYLFSYIQACSAIIQIDESSQGVDFMKTALITGASSGIGLEMSYRFAEDGYQLVLVSRNRNTLEKISAEIGQKYYVPVQFIDADLSDYDAPQEVYERVTALGVQVDVLVNNAGYGLYGPFLDNDRSEELKMIDLNIRALTHLTKLFLPHMIQQRSGGVINVASTAAFQSGPLFAVYSATKAYVLSFTEALANEMQGSGVTVTAFCPGPTATAFMDRSNLKVSKLLRMGLMDVKKAVDVGYKGFNQRRIIVIPGLRNRVLTVLNRFIPRQWVVKVTRSISERE